MIPPAHYALSEILIVIASLYTARQLSTNKNYFALIGILLLGLTAAIGAVRFGIINSELIVQINKILALYAGISALSLVSTQLVFNSYLKNFGKYIFLIALVSILGALLFPKLLLLNLIYLWSIVSIILSIFLCEKIIAKKILNGILMSILIFGFLFLSKRGLFAESLGADLSFHLYHIFIAAWILSMGYVLNLRNN
tara:strand:+ start:1234 stop:1824 length:591 start_codon:yes stop_codon:yes gene_type:complete